MPRFPEAKKDVISCEKLRLGANNLLSRRYPNGPTHPGAIRETLVVADKWANPAN